MNDVLADGDWHDVAELLTVAFPAITPEAAYRAAVRVETVQRRLYGARPRAVSDDVLVLRGKRSLVLAYLAAHGIRCERRRVGHVLQYRAVKVICPACKQPFLLRTPRGRYCSLKCGQAHRHLPAKPCESCRKPFVPPGSRVRFCCRTCASNARRKVA